MPYYLITIWLLCLSCTPSEQRGDDKEKYYSSSVQACPAFVAELPNTELSEISIKLLRLSKDVLAKPEEPYLNRFSTRLGSSNIFLYRRSAASECSIVVYQKDVYDEVTEKLILLTLNKQGNIVDHISLAENIPYPDGIQTVSSVVKDSRIVQTRVLEAAGEYDKKRDITLSIDSVVTIVDVSPSGSIKLFKKDSTRIIR